ncbi:MAG: hypothetical protein BAJALOKI3v1_1320001 [Promethearchaeota archaeon]|nr:MAG: hypothetical protein BAJALOKI3v1_1320001 [Candidatus Lokiarchaeota archaeon]
MKQILPEIRELVQHLNFLKICCTNSGFRHIQHYINGLIAVEKKTIKQISEASLEENHHSAIARILSEGRLKEDVLKERYLKKVAYYAKGQEVYLLIDDTLSKHEGDNIYGVQVHKSHTSEGYVKGHQFLTGLLCFGMYKMPLFPLLYTKETDSKIEMAKHMFLDTIKHVQIHTVLFDSWYADKSLIKMIKTKGSRVICQVKTNRCIKHLKKYVSLKKYSDQIHLTDKFWIDGTLYKAEKQTAKLKHVPLGALVFSEQYFEKNKVWSRHIHIFSTQKNDSIVEILRTYKQRWAIEVLHRDLKQNLGFDKAMIRSKKGIVRHTILCVLAYAILQMFMAQHNLNMTIGECIRFLREQNMNNFIQEIVEIEDKNKRMEVFEMRFIRKTAKV